MRANHVATLLVHDARLQWRYGIHAAYAFVIVFYCAAIYGAGRYLPEWAVAALVFSDPAAVGFFFLGALMMLERSERVRAALAVSPLDPVDYLIAKTLTLTTLAVIACLLIGAVFHRGENLALLTLAVVLTSVQFIGLGVPIALKFRTVSGYLIGSAGFLAPVITPGFLALLDPTPVWLYLVPAVSQFKLMLVATSAAHAAPLELALMLVVAALAAALCVWLAVASLGREFGGR